MDEFGFVEPLVWNRRTGNLVGGHQRLKILAARSGSRVTTSKARTSPSRSTASRHCVSIYDARAGGPAQRVGFGPCGKRNGGSQLLCAGKWPPRRGLHDI